MTKQVNLTRGSRRIRSADARLPPFAAEADGAFAPLADETRAPSPADLAALACEIYDSRRLRSQFLSESLLGEPVWDMLLALYCAAAKAERVSVSALCLAAAVPSTTGLRWLQLLEQKKLVERCKDHLDGRRFWVRLTDESHAIMTDYLTALMRRTARNRAKLQICQQRPVTE